MRMRIVFKGLLMIFLLSLPLLFLTACSGITKQPGEGAPRPAVYVNDTIYLVKSEVRDTLPDGWEEIGEIEYKLTHEERIDEKCKDYTANCTSGEVGDKLYANKEDDDRIYLQIEKDKYVLYVKCYESMIYVQDALYVREGGYFGDSSEKTLSDDWSRIGTIRKVVYQDAPMVSENFTGNDSTLMSEGDELYGNKDEPNRIYIKCSNNEYIPFIK